ncbi:MAG: glycoside hydrolase family 32 protein [Coriobacteriales bacterium]|nr:glycoside hydrolase family 32 protein [Coriobacteriales bacterium]
MSNESWRPKLHVAPYSGSISDPNGLCEFKGTYHFFCQNAPTYPGDVDSAHGWGHFATRDLVHYTFLGCHVFPDSPADKDGSYSGGAYINEDTDEVWFYFTGNVRDGEGDGTYSGRLANQTLMKSYNGINLQGKEVVLDNSGYPAYCSCHVRDPKVWKQDGKLHMMLGARTREDSRGAIMMYDSEDGYKWEMTGSVTNLEEKPFGYMWECPDRIVLNGREFLSTCPQGMAKAADSCGSSRPTAQNVHAAGYFPIDGKIIDLMYQDTERMDAAAPRAAIDEKTCVDWDYGFDFYACQSLLDEQGRTILIGWMSLPHDEDDVRPYDNPTATWRGCLTVPRVLTYCEKCGRIRQQPAAEIDALRGEPQNFDGSVTTAKCADIVLDGIEGEGTLRFGDFLELRFADGMATLEFTDDTVGQGRKVRQAEVPELHNIRVLVDTSVLEIFVNNGSRVFGTRYFDESDELTVSHDFKAATQVCYPMDEVEVNYLVTR